MRSYYEHIGEKVASTSTPAPSPILKPVYRSSAIFPVLQNANLSSRILFMGYWGIKRKISQLTKVVTLRDQQGTILSRTTQPITEAKAYRIELAELLAPFFKKNQDFLGSVEVEFFSAEDLHFPYPAVAVNYYGSEFSSIVHTAQRVYNNFEDRQNNSQVSVPEAGFNIYADEEFEPFVALVNGPEKAPQMHVRAQFFNIDNETLTHDFFLGSLEPYQTVFLPLNQEVGLASFLKKAVGTAKLFFELDWIFPRLIVGNFNRSHSVLTLTHSYYDCSSAEAKRDFWSQPEAKAYPASLMIPLTCSEEVFTKIYFYPIYSPASFVIDLEIYNHKGELLGKKEKALMIDSTSHAEYLLIDFNRLCTELGVKLTGELAARVIARGAEGGAIPARIKIGYDRGFFRRKDAACNICMNLQPYHKAWENKRSSFKWAPLFVNPSQSSLWVMNSSPMIDRKEENEVTLLFYREQDGESVSRQIILPPEGYYVLHMEEEKELQMFFAGQVGWCVVLSTNPYSTVYYFLDHPSGVVGGDHGF